VQRSVPHDEEACVELIGEEVDPAEDSVDSSSSFPVEVEEDSVEVKLADEVVDGVPVRHPPRVTRVRAPQDELQSNALPPISSVTVYWPALNP
jgi:hypothetical protein